MGTETAERQWRGQMCVDFISTKLLSARLTVSAEQIKLAGVLGEFVFRQEDITIIGKAGFVPWLGCGIRIGHKTAKYPKQIMFLPLLPFLSRSQDILRYVQSLGYNSTLKRIP